MPGEDDETIIIRAILRDELSDPADDVTKALNDLGDTMDDTSARTEKLTEAEQRNADQSAKTTRQIQAENQARDENGRLTRQQTTSTEDNTKVLRTNTRERNKSTKAIKKHGAGLGKLVGLFTQFVKVGAALDAIPMAVSAVGALGTAAAVAGNGIATLSGSLLTMPTMLAGIGQAAIVGKLAFAGMGDAIGALASGDYTKFADATKDMAPNMTNAAKAMGVLGQQWKPIVKDIQDKVWQGLGDQITNVGGKILPLVQKSFMATAGHINEALNQSLEFAGSANGIRQFGKILDATGKISGQFTQGLTAGFVGLTGVMSAASPAAVKLGGAISGAFVTLASKIQMNQDAIANFAMKGVDAILKLFRAIGQFGVGLWNIMRLASGLTKGLGTSLEDMAKKFRAWTESTKGKNDIRAYFESMRPIFAAIGNLVKQLATALGGLSNTPGLADLINKLAGMIPTFVELVNQASGRFIPALLDIAASLADVVVDSGALHVTAVLLAGATVAAQGLAAAFGALPGPIQVTIGTVVGLAFAIKGLYGTTMGAWLLKILGVTKALKYMQAQMLIFGTAAKGAFATGGIKGFFSYLMMSFRALKVAIWTSLIQPLMAFLVSNPIGWIILAVIALVAVFVILWKKCEGFRNLVKSIGQWFVDVWNNKIKPAALAAWDWVVGTWNRIWASLKPIIMWIVNFYIAAWKFMFNVYKTVALIYIKYIAAAWKILVAVIRVVVNVIVAIWNWGVQTIGPIISYIVDWIKNKWEEIKPAVTSLWNKIVEIFNKIRDTVMPIITTVVNWIKDNFSKLKVLLIPLLMPIAIIFGIIAAVIIGVVAIVVGVIVAGFYFVKYVVIPIIEAIIGTIKLIWTAASFVVRLIIAYFTFGWNLIKAIVMGVVNGIIAIINWIKDNAQNVINAVQGFFSAGWAFISGVVSGAINVITGTISGLRDRASSVVDSIKNFFVGGFNSIKDTVSSIINWIMDKISSVKDALSGIGNAVSSIIPGLFAGGTVTVGQPTMIGELGPEAFVTHTGKVEMIGTHGPEVMSFSRPGYVVPNHVLNGYSDSSVPGNVMNKLAKSFAPQEPTQGTHTQTERKRLSEDTYMQTGSNGDTYNFQGAHFGGDPVATKKAVVEAIREIERNKKERS